MKKLTAFLLAVMMIFVCAACGDTIEEEASIIAFYSIKSAQGEFVVEVQDLGGVYSELYDEEGIYIKFKGSEEKIYDSEGKEVSRDELHYGDTLQIHYNGKLSSKNPKTITATKIVVVK